MTGITWKRTADELPVDDSEVFAAILWEEKPSGKREYGIHDCSFYRGGPGSGQAIFADTEGEEFEATEVQYWIYKAELAASVPSESQEKSR